MLQIILITPAILSLAAEREGSSQKKPDPMVAAQLYVFGQRSRRVADPLDDVLATVKRAQPTQTESPR